MGKKTVNSRPVKVNIVMLWKGSCWESVPQIVSCLFQTFNSFPSFNFYCSRFFAYWWIITWLFLVVSFYVSIFSVIKRQVSFVNIGDRKAVNNLTKTKSRINTMLLPKVNVLPGSMQISFHTHFCVRRYFTILTFNLYNNIRNFQKVICLVGCICLAAYQPLLFV